MGRNYKTVKNGRGTELVIGEGKYISVGLDGTDITIRGNGNVIKLSAYFIKLNIL